LKAIAPSDSVARVSLADVIPPPSVVATILENRRRRKGFRALYRKYSSFTMIHEAAYVNNLELCARFAAVPGCVVECGVWRGGMIAGMAEVLGADRKYFLFDSFEGLPPAREELDGASAVAWQKNANSPVHYNNCTAAEEEAAAAMKLSGAKSFSLIKGWFNERLQRFVPPSEIAVLRLDCDWYESTRTCLENLYPHVAPGGVVIVDDYFIWDGCARAVNEFVSGLASPSSVPRLSQFHDLIAYVVKSDNAPPAKNGKAGQGG
jgi:O-methyltransferase